MTDYVAGSLIVLGSLIAFIGSVGMLKFRSFYQRVHPPTMGSTLGTALILFGSMIYFSVAESRPVLHEVLILLLMTVSTPVTYLLLVRAAIHRGRATGPDPDEQAGAATHLARQDREPRSPGH